MNRDKAQDEMAAAAIELEKEKEIRTREWNVSISRGRE